MSSFWDNENQSSGAIDMSKDSRRRDRRALNTEEEDWPDDRSDVSGMTGISQAFSQLGGPMGMEGIGMGYGGGGAGMPYNEHNNNNANDVRKGKVL